MEIHIGKDVEEFIKSMDAVTVAKIVRTEGLLREFGYRIGLPHSKKVAGNIFELRIRGQLEVRIFYCFYQNRIYLLSAFIKKTQKIPLHELAKTMAKYKALTKYNL